MICPHCNKTIEEQERYLMSRDPNGEMVWTKTQRTVAAYVILFLILVGLFVIVAPHLYQ